MASLETRIAACECIKRTLGAALFDFSLPERIKPTDPPILYSPYPAQAGGKGVTLHDLYRFCVGQQSMRLQVTKNRRMQALLTPLLDVGPTATAFAQLLTQLPVACQPEEVMTALAEWFAKALGGEPSTVVAGVCPDYAHQNGVYTFDELRDGVGLVAGRVVEAVRTLAAFFEQHELPVSFVLAAADHEADDLANCDRVSVTQEEFRCRVRKSQLALASVCNGYKVVTPFITEVGDWPAVLEEARRAVAMGKYAGPFSVTQEHLGHMAEMRRPLYAKWHNGDIDALALLLAQIPEYAALPALLCRNFPNPLVLDSGTPLMRIFMHGLSTTVRPMIGLDTSRY